MTARKIVQLISPALLSVCLAAQASAAIMIPPKIPAAPHAVTGDPAQRSKANSGVARAQINSNNSSAGATRAVKLELTSNI